MTDIVNTERRLRRLAQQQGKILCKRDGRYGLIEDTSGNRLRSAEARVSAPARQSLDISQVEDILTKQ